MTENRKRWEILDKLFQSNSPVSTDEIFREWSSAGITVKTGPKDDSFDEKYGITLRQDIFKFKAFYKEAGLTGPLFLETTQKDNNRRKAYKYAKEGFSILPILGASYTRSDWASLDRCMKKLYNELPQSMADEVQFLVKSHMDVLRGKEKTIDWSENKQLKGYGILPTIYRYLSEKRPFYVEYQRFNSPLQRFIFHPHLLKQYNGRWWCLGYREGKNPVTTISVDGILPGSISAASIPLRQWEDTEHPASEYYDNVIGVTKKYNSKSAKKYNVSDGEYTIRIGVHSQNAWDYLVTKPIHPSQTITVEFDKEKKSYGQVTIQVITNIEMYHRILSLGVDYEVESPEFVRREMKDTIQKMYSRY